MEGKSVLISPENLAIHKERSPYSLRTLVGLEKLVVAKTGSKKVGDIKEAEKWGL